MASSPKNTPPRSTTAAARAAPPKTNIGRRRAANARDSSEFYQERQQEILRTAGLVFQENGYQAASIGDIAERLGTDRASIYYYFSSKEELLQKMVREATLNNVTAIEEIVASKRPAGEKLRLAFVTQMDSYQKSYPYMNVFLQEKFPTLSKDRSAWNKEINQWSERYYRAFYQIIQQGVEAGEIKIDLPVGLATMAVIGVVNWAHRWYKPGGKLSVESIGEGFAAILMDGLRARSTAK